LGFAIPIEMVKQVYDQILDHGSVVRGFLGVRIQGLTPEMAQHFGVKESQGVVVGEVQHGAPGEKAGLKQADVIVEMDGKKIEEPASFRNAIAMKSPGTTVHLTVVREGNRLDIPATLEKLPESAKEGSAVEEAKSTNAWGLSVQPLTSDLAKKFGYKEEAGLVIAEVAPDSPASAAGLEPGMLISQVNRKSVGTKDEFDQAVKADHDSKSLLLLVKTNQGSRFVVLKAE
jgi:serine protease Do